MLVPMWWRSGGGGGGPFPACTPISSIARRSGPVPLSRMIRDGGGAGGGCPGGEAMTDTAMAAARSRRQGELDRKSDKKEFMGDMQRAHLDQQEQLKRAAAEMARNHEAEKRDLRHQRDVAVGAAERGRQAAAAVAPTIAYSGPEDAATIAYPQHFDISGRSRSPLLPTGSARSVSSSHSHSHSHDPKNDALSAYSKRGRGKSRK